MSTLERRDTWRSRKIAQARIIVLFVISINININIIIIIIIIICIFMILTIISSSRWLYVITLY